MENKVKKAVFCAAAFLFVFTFALTGGAKVTEVEAAVDPAEAVCWMPDSGEYFMSVDDAVDKYTTAKIQLLKNASEGAAGDTGGVTINRAYRITLDLNGFTLSNKLPENIYTIIVGSDAKLEINDSDSQGRGRITNNAPNDPDNPCASTIFSRQGIVIINAGTIEAEHNYAFSLDKDLPEKNWNEIHGGTFIAPEGKTLYNPFGAYILRIYGGRFKDDVANDADHYNCMDQVLVYNQESGFYELAPFAARISETGQGYLTLGEAYEAVQEGQTIRLVADIDNGANAFETGKTYTLDLDAHTISSSAAQTILAAGGSLTIQDSHAFYEDTGKISNSNNSGSAVHVNGADVTVRGGDLSGAYGVSAEAGAVTIPNDTKATIQGNTSSVSSGENVTFNIYGGYYSDNAGNGKDFNRPEGKELVKIPAGKDHAGWYELTDLDKTELAGSIENAQKDSDATAVSETGKDLPDGKEYVSRAVKDAFEQAIADAQAIYDDPANQDEVDAAKTALDAAKQAFDDAKQTAVTDKSALRKAVEEAIDPKDITESADGNDVVYPELWATPADKRFYEDALQQAKDILDDPDASQNDIDQALKALEDSAVNIGTGNLVRITYDPNGGVFRGSTGPTVEQHVMGTDMAVAEAPVREGYTFLYWKGSEYQPGDTYKATEHHTFTAQWQREEQSDDSGSKSAPGSGKSGSGSYKSGKTAASVSTMKMGDVTAVGFWLVVMTIAAAGAIAAIFRIRVK